MAKNFNKSGLASKTFGEVAKKSAEKAQVITVRMIPNEKLVDYPKNREDVTDTADLENSIKELGFTDPIEVTDFNMPDGMYMIVSGHRRRSAGVKCGLDMFPCIVKSFDDEQSIENYVLLSNSQRDSAKDPLLFCTRYKYHEEYLKEINFQGKFRDEIARRMGISTPQADRYNTMNKVIVQVWDMVREEVVGMSSVLPMASHSLEEQLEIYHILQEALSHGVSLTRETVKRIVDSYRNGKRSWAEIADLPRDSGLPLNGFINTDPAESSEPEEPQRNDEVRREHDPIADEADKMDADREAWEQQQEEEADPEEGSADAEKGKKKQPLSEDEKRMKRAKDIQKDLEKLNTDFADVYAFADADEAEETLRNMASTFSVIVDEMSTISSEYDLGEVFKSMLDELKSKVNEY